MAPADLGVAAGQDEWARTSGIPHTHPLVGGPDWGPDSSGFQPDAGVSRIAGMGAGAMPGGAPAGPGRARAQFGGWQELLDPHSPMLWLLLFAMAAVSLVHFRLEGRVGPARAAAGLG